MDEQPHVVSQMSRNLQREVERQLLLDLDHYLSGSAAKGLTVDWSNPCQEGHCTEALGSTLEEMSDVAVRDGDGKLVAEGWIDFVHGGGALPLHVFWLFLDLVDGERLTRVKDDVAIPDHVWAGLSDDSKDACAVQGRYDSSWEKDPKVQAWRRDRRLTRPEDSMDVVARICDLPLQFKARGTVSVIQLVDESGYRAAPGALTVEAVSTYLREHPDLIEEWLAYSGDKRTSSGWYVTQRAGDSFEVGYHPKGERISITGRAPACAEFIVREVRSIAG